MKAIWYERQGAARDVLEQGEMATPQAGPGEVRVKLAASAVNPADCLRRRGAGYPLEFPRIVPNSDGAGIVDQVGRGVAERWLGKRVWLYNGQRFRPFGTAAEYIALAADLVTELPDSVGMAEGATLGIPCMTAHRGVFVAGAVQGKTILVTGGAGAVGHYAIQLAKWAGARVITTVSSEAKARHAETAGPDRIVNYRTEDVVAKVKDATGGQGVDHIVDVDFGGNLAATLELVKPNGSLAFYASRGNMNPALPVAPLIRLNLAIHSIGLPHSPLEARHRAQSDITAWLRSGPRALTVASRFPLHDTALAHEAVERGDKRGTVIVDIGDGV